MKDGQILGYGDRNKILLNVRVMVIPNVIDAHETTPKGFGKGLKELMVWFVGFYGIATFVGYLKPNSFLCK